MAGKRYDLTSKRFGRLVALEHVPNNRKEKAKWICRCDCGNIVKVQTGHLRSGNTQSCGCIQNLNFVEIGKRYGRLMVIEGPIFTINKAKQWLCKCDCGKTKNIYNARLLAGKTNSCGCIVVENNQKRSIRYKEMTGRFWSRTFYNAKARNIPFLIDREYAYSILEQQNFKCVLSGVDISFSEKTASLDRIDSTKGYEKGNIQWLHATVNVMKLDHEENYFIHFCTLVSEHAKRKNETKCAESIARAKGFADAAEGDTGSGVG